MTRLAAAVAAAIALAALGGAAPRTLALFVSGASATASFQALTVAPPTGLTGRGGASASLSWTPTGTARASGYYLFRSSTSGSGYAQVGNVTPASTASTSDAPASGTWYYVLQTYAGAWTSANSNEASVVVARTPTTTPAVGCDPTMQAPVTTNSGNDDGYETNPGNACAADGAVATDAGSGTDASTSCTDPGKDRHRFWGYAFGLPASVTAVNGITLTVTAGTGGGNGKFSLCVELSGDGGATWSAPRQVSLGASAPRRYTIGSSTDTWGHAWTAAGLTASAFRVQVTDVVNKPNGDFLLDDIAASVTYTP